jgi:DNA-binding response OmpR family regulator
MLEIKVLIIAEEPDFTDILTDRLQSWGFIVTSAGNSDEAIAVTTQFQPHVVVLSLRAEHGHDLETLRRVKSLNDNIEIILLTSKGTALVGMQGIELGAFDCMPQPIELGVLIEKIRQAYAQHSASSFTLQGFF